MDMSFEVEKYKQALKNADLDFFDINLATGEAKQSENLTLKMGYTLEEVDTFEKRNATFHPGDLQNSLIEVEKLMSGKIETTNLLFRVYGKKGELFWLKHDGSIVEKDGERHFVGILRDVTTEKQYLDSLHRLANFDSLTEMYNRRSGLAKLGKVISDQSEVVILYLDFDHFKYINDHYGHETGDRLLKEFSKKALSHLPELSFGIRIGGDEFVFAFVGQEITEVEKIIANLQKDYVYYDHEKLNFSYGLIKYNEAEHENLENLIHIADQKMYKHKRKKLEYQK